MYETGIVRPLDQLGKIVLPVELRRMLNIGDRDSLEFYSDGSKLILKQYRPACIFCNSLDDVKTHKGKNVCKKCIDELLK